MPSVLIGPLRRDDEFPLGSVSSPSTIFSALLKPMPHEEHAHENQQGSRWLPVCIPALTPCCRVSLKCQDDVRTRKTGSAINPVFFSGSFAAVPFSLHKDGAA